MQVPFAYPETISVRLFNRMRSCNLRGIVVDEMNPDDFSKISLQVEIRRPEFGMDRTHCVGMKSVSIPDQQELRRVWDMERSIRQMNSRLSLAID